MSHLTFDRISAIAEGDAATPAERRHLDECLACIDQMSDVRSVLAIAKTLGDIAPPSDAWDGIRARVGIGKRTARRWPAGRWVAAAAAIIIVAGGALLLPLGDGGTNALKGAKVAQQPAPVAAAVERQFTQTLEVLSQTLDTQRPVLAKSVVVVVDKSLADIDAAISETRDALRADPENPALVDILSSHYERKVDLLQRATELASSS